METLSSIARQVGCPIIEVEAGTYSHVPADDEHSAILDQLERWLRKCYNQNNPFHKQARSILVKKYGFNEFK